ncbi:Oxygen sensor protein DosP [compost metagenome]
MLENAKDLVNKLHTSGASIAIDDFGKSYSNYDRLLLDWLDIKYIKLDRAFTAKCWDSKVFILIEGMVKAFNKMGVKFIAEGVETPDEKEILRRAGVTLLQGYYLGRPEYFENLLDKKHALADTQAM